MGVTLLVASLDPLEGLDASRHIATAGYTYKWMDHTNILVVLRASGGAAVRKAGELAVKVRGVVQWLDFNDWRSTPKVPQVHNSTLQMDSANGDVRAHNLEL